MATEKNEETNLIDEVEFLINDIGFAVNTIAMSQVLTQSPNLVFLNIETKDNDRFTVRLNPQGLHVVSNEFDKDDGGSEKHAKTYETIYALLENISPSYVGLFGKALTEKLTALKKLEEEQKTE